MPVDRKYRGRVITPEDIAFLRRFLAQHSGLSRRKLSAKVCEAWQWKQANGALCDMVCRGLLLMLHRAGEIQLPEVRFLPRNPMVVRERPALVPVDTTPLIARLNELRPLEVRQVRRTSDEPLFNSLVEHHHYLGYEQPVGEHLKYLVRAQGRPIACMAWSSAPRHLGSRDRYIGWSQEARKRNIRLIAYNTRFLILPWVQVPHLASHILSRVAATLSSDWERMCDSASARPASVRIRSSGLVGIAPVPLPGARTLTSGRPRPGLAGLEMSSPYWPPLTAYIERCRKEESDWKLGLLQGESPLKRRSNKVANTSMPYETDIAAPV